MIRGACAVTTALNVKTLDEVRVQSFVEDEVQFSGRFRSPRINLDYKYLRSLLMISSPGPIYDIC